MDFGKVGGANVSAIGVDLSSMDLETALLMVQQQRTELLDTQLKEQIEEVNQRNKLTSKLNELQAKLNALKNSLNHDAKASDKVPDNDQTQKAAREYAQICLELGVSTAPVDVANVKHNPDGTVSFDLKMKEVKKFVGIDFDKGLTPKFETTYEWDARPKKEGIETALGDIKSQIDSASNAQQMDMLRLQSMSNKRNEAFDVMTNFIKKMQDSRSSIIGNMR